MKNKKHHVLSILLIIFMIIMAVSTSRRPPKEIKNSISYETRGEYYLIKIKTRADPNKYGIFGSYNTSRNSLQLYFNDHEEIQVFQENQSGEIITEILVFGEGEEEKYMIDEHGEIITEKYITKGHILLKKMILNDEYFGTFTENGYFIIKIKKEILMYENPRLEYIYLNGNNGEYVDEVYYE